ncbi:MAG: 2,5-diamino-6-(ribosylamino)-4(3H)-pyrimidinone 5'-phosphate reductase [Halobacteriota archaeon]|nr:2,5-diamino-6-(ribosylamino)-4(3H)-pyrimidinone 5'-phosphate reductase [Halobacteriota archaeon]
MKERPFVFINSAMSADGKISTTQRVQVRISDDIDFDRVDDLRAGSDAIIVGIGTVLSDDPSLTVKSDERKKERVRRGEDENPIRVVVDSRARTPLDSDILKKGNGRRIIFVSEAAPEEDVKALQCYSEVISVGKDKVDLEDMLQKLGRMGVKRVMVEGGGTLNWAFLSGRLVDELYVYIGYFIMGGKGAPTLVDGGGFKVRPDMPELKLIDLQKMENGMVLRWRIGKRLPK